MTPRPLTSLSAQRRGTAGDAGSVSLLAVGLAFAMLLAIGLAVDGSRKSAATSDATSIAEEAARAGGQALRLEALATGGPAVVDPDRAIAEAQSYLAASGATGTATVDGARITVQATITRPTIFLGLVGITEVTGNGSGAADLVSAG